MLSVMQTKGGRISVLVGRNTSPKFICEKTIGIKKKGNCHIQCNVVKMMHT